MVPETQWATGVAILRERTVKGRSISFESLAVGCADPHGLSRHCSLRDAMVADVMGWVDVVQI